MAPAHSPAMMTSRTWPCPRWRAPAPAAPAAARPAARHEASAAQLLVHLHVHDRELVDLLQDVIERLLEVVRVCLVEEALDGALAHVLRARSDERVHVLAALLRVEPNQLSKFW